MDLREEDKLRGKPPIFKVAFSILKELMSDLLSGKCTEDELYDMVSSITPHKHGYKREEDYATIDKGMGILGIGNRNKFIELMRENGIVNEQFNTKNIGYDKKKIYALKHKQEEEYQQRLAKQKRKKKLEKEFG